MAPTRQGRRQRRIARRRQEILAAAAQIFAQKGYAGATTKEIAKEADVAEGTLYNYFGGKREILHAIAVETKAPMEEALLGTGTLENREAMVVLFERAFDLVEARMPFIRALWTEAWTDDLILHEYVIARLGRVSEQIQAYIAKRVADGTFRPVSPTLGAQLVMGMFLGLVLPALRGMQPLPPPSERRELAETIVDLLLDGVRVRQE
jgi:AcrR family transcriptional regulator